MVKNSLFRSTPLNHSPFSYQNFGVRRVEIQRGNGVPLAGTPLDTSSNVCLYYITITGLGFAKSGNGIKLEDFDENHFFLVFDLTFTEEASKSLAVFPELTGSGLTFKLYFSKALDDAVKLFLIGERFSQVFIDCPQHLQKHMLDGLRLSQNWRRNVPRLPVFLEAFDLIIFQSARCPRKENQLVKEGQRCHLTFANY